MAIPLLCVMIRTCAAVQDVGEMSQQEVIKVFLKSNKALLAEFKEANSVLLQQLQVILPLPSLGFTKSSSPAYHT